MNRVTPGSFLTLHYRLSGPDGEAVVDTFAGQPATLSLGTGDLAPAIEARLVGMAEGESATFELAPGEAFGERSPDLVQRVGRAMVERLGDGAGGYQVGDVVRFPTPDGGGGYAGVIREVDDETLTFDFNHPLAGRPVRFDVQLIGVL
ncbi:FKBP-type peptidyl-prolyl cis-trans isomerase [Piscinibacter koreensis]|uniref:FKBP-type peptidyl-prolyl cis-trans isomerase n=1 Tax=Piscinibacter koreensis TaxID=2742824 RepID=UPI001FEB4CB0|nr:peptidylprolyl isomerase [Schlegelella koreensis]